jgi:hypothetical protein
MNGSSTPFVHEVMVPPYHTLSRWFPKTLACAHPWTNGSWEPFLDDEMVSLYHTHSRGGSQKPVPGVLRVLENHPAMNGSLTPFLDDGMVSSYRPI